MFYNNLKQASKSSDMYFLEVSITCPLLATGAEDTHTLSIMLGWCLYILSPAVIKATQIFLFLLLVNSTHTHLVIFPITISLSQVIVSDPYPKQQFMCIMNQAINSCFHIMTILENIIFLHTFTWSGCLSANEASSEHHCDIMSNAGTGQSRQEALVNWWADWKDGNRPRQLARTVNSSSSFLDMKLEKFRLIPRLLILK